jgi:hypothetical protein
MLMLSVLVALDLGTFFATPSVPAQINADVDVSGKSYVVHGFYEAVNAVLIGETPAALAAFTSPVIETHTGGAADHGRDALGEYVLGLQKRGIVALDVVRIMGSGNDLAAVVEPRTTARNTVTRSNAEPSSRRIVEQFRLEAGQISAYWPGSLDGEPPNPVPAATVPKAGGDAAVSLARLQLGPHTSPTAFVTPFPHLLVIETGAVAVGRDDALALAPVGATRFTELPADPKGQDLLLGPGDAVLALAGVRQELRNAGEAPASVLSVLIAPREAYFAFPPGAARGGPTLAQAHNPSRTGTRVTWPNQVISETLAFAVLPDASGQTTSAKISGTSLTLDPGQRLPAPAPAASRFAIVQSGAMDLLDADAEALPAATPMNQVNEGSRPSRLFRAGEAIALDASNAVVLENPGSARLDLLLIAVE